MLTSTKYIALVHLVFLYRHIFCIFSLDIVCMINQQDLVGSIFLHNLATYTILNQIRFLVPRLHKRHLAAAAHV